jgi:hypothetical protein
VWADHRHFTPSAARDARPRRTAAR